MSNQYEMTMKFNFDASDDANALNSMEKIKSDIQRGVIDLKSSRIGLDHLNPESRLGAEARRPVTYGWTVR